MKRLILSLSLLFYSANSMGIDDVDDFDMTATSDIGSIDYTYNDISSPGYVINPTDITPTDLPQVVAVQALTNNSVFVLTKNTSGTANTQLMQLDSTGSATSAAISIGQPGGADVIVDSQGRALVVGGNGSQGWISRYIPTAGFFTIDPTCHDGTILLENTVTSFSHVRESRNGTILALGQNAKTGYIMAYSQDGQSDTTFGNGIGYYKIPNVTLTDMVVDASGNIYVIGSVAKGTIQLYCILPDGSGLHINYGSSGIIDTGLLIANYSSAKMTGLNSSGGLTMIAVDNATGTLEMQAYTSAGQTAHPACGSLTTAITGLKNPVITQFKVDVDDNLIFVGYDDNFFVIGRCLNDMILDTIENGDFSTPFASSSSTPGILKTAYNDIDLPVTPQRAVNCVTIAPNGAIIFGGYENLTTTATLPIVGNVIGNQTVSSNESYRYSGSTVGTFNTTFGTSGIQSLTSISATGNPQALYVLNNNKILVGVTNGSNTILGQLTSAYALDTGSFGSGTGKITLTGLVNLKQIMIDASGNIYVLGDNGSHMMLFKVSSVGVSVWSITSTVLTLGNVVLEQISGRIVVAGYDGTHGSIVGLNPSTGAIDLDFGIAGYYTTSGTTQIAGAAITSTDRIVFTYNASSSATVQRIYSNGSALDTSFSFGTALSTVTGGDNQIKLQLDNQGNIVIVINNGSGFKSSRYTPNGANSVINVATAVANASTLTLSQVLSLNSGQTLILGNNSNGNKAIVARLTSAFALDTANFNSAGATPGLLQSSVGSVYPYYALDVNSTAAASPTVENILIPGLNSTTPGLTALYNDAVVTKVNQNQSDASNLDPLFGGTFASPGGGFTTLLINSFNDTFTATVIQPDGNIVAVGYTQLTSGGNYSIVVARYLSTGLLDTVANGGSGFGTSGQGYVVTAIGTTSQAYAVGLQAINGSVKIVVGGSTTTSGTTSMFVARYLATGLLDNTTNDGANPFGTSGQGYTTLSVSTSTFCYGLAINTANNNIIAVGKTNGGTATSNFIVASFGSTGTLNSSTFGPSGTTPGYNITGPAFAASTVNSAQAVIIQQPITSSSNIIVGGYSQQASGGETYFTIAEYTSTGVLNINNFGTPLSSGYTQTRVSGTSGTTTVDKIFAMAQQANGNIVVAGSSQVGSSQTYIGIARYLGTGANAGQLDTTFNTTGFALTSLNGFTDYANAVGLQADGKIVVAGPTSLISGAGNSVLGIVRYTSAGLLDTTFGQGTGYVSTSINGTLDTPQAIGIQSDGKIIIAGFTSYLTPSTSPSAVGTPVSVSPAWGYSPVAYSISGTTYLSVTTNPDGRIGNFVWNAGTSSFTTASTTTTGTASATQLCAYTVGGTQYISVANNGSGYFTTFYVSSTTPLTLTATASNQTSTNNPNGICSFTIGVNTYIAVSNSGTATCSVFQFVPGATPPSTVTFTQISGSPFTIPHTGNGICAYTITGTQYISVTQGDTTTPGFTTFVWNSGTSTFDYTGNPASMANATVSTANHPTGICAYTIGTGSTNTYISVANTGSGTVTTYQWTNGGTNPFTLVGSAVSITTPYYVTAYTIGTTPYISVPSNTGTIVNTYSWNSGTSTYNLVNSLATDSQPYGIFSYTISAVQYFAVASFAGHSCDIYGFISTLVPKMLVARYMNGSEVGSVDVTYNQAGTNPGYLNMHTELGTTQLGTPNQAKAVLQTTSGSYYVAADNGSGNTSVTLFSSDDVQQSTFGASGVLTITGLFNVSQMFIDQAGYLVVIGGSGGSGSNAGWIKQYNATTGVATSFAASTVLDIHYAIAQQANGRYLVAGQQTGNATIIAYSPLTGAVDQTFATNGLYTGFSSSAIHAMQVDTSSKIYIISNNGTSGTTQQLTINGKTVGWTGSTTVANATTISNQLAIDQNSDIVIATVNSSTNAIIIKRYTGSTGVEAATLTLATTTTGFTTPFITSIMIDATASSAGNIILTGYDSTTLKPFVLRVLASITGGLDTSFNATGIQNVIIPSATTTAWNGGFIDQEGKILVAGYGILSATNTPYLMRVYGNQFIGQYTVTVPPATPGTIDTTFGTNGEVLLASLSGASSLAGLTPQVVVPDSSGNYYIAFTSGALVRLTNAAVLDTSFAPLNTGFASPTPAGTYSMVFDGSSRLIVAGTNGGAGWLNRYNAGLSSLDTTFNSNTAASLTTSTLATVALQQTLSRYIVAGQNTAGHGALFAFTNSGILDVTFNSNGSAGAGGGGTTPGIFDTGVSQPIYGFVADQYDRLLIAYRNGTGIDLVRLTSAGQIDTTFGSNGTISAAIPTNADSSTQVRLAIDASGNIVIAAHVTVSATPKVAVKAYANGSGTSIAATEFDITGLTSPTLTSLITTSDGKVLVGGYQSGSNQMWVARIINSAGVYGLDSTTFAPSATIPGIMQFKFDAAGTVTARILNSIAIYTNGEIAMVGTETDTATSPNINPFLSMAYNNPYATQQPISQNSKAIGTNDITLGASSTSATNLGVTFFGNSGGSTASGQVARAVALENNANIVVALDGGTAGATTPSNIFINLFNIDGTLNTTFNTTGQQTITQIYQNQFVRDMVTFTTVAGVNKAILAGYATNTTLGATDSLVLQYNLTSAAFDTTFGGYDGNPAGVAFGDAKQAFVVGVQSTGRVIVGGLDQAGAGLLLGYTSNGKLDYSFGTNGYFAQGTTGIYTHAIDTSNRIVVAYNNGSNVVNVARILADGSGLDTSFNATGIITTSITGISGNTNMKVVVDGSGNVYVAAVNSSGANIVINKYTSSGAAGTPASLTITSANLGGLTGFTIGRLLVDSNGKIIVVAYTTTKVIFVRTTTALAFPDSTFNPSGTPGYLAYTIDSSVSQLVADALIHPDGRIIAVGSE